MSTGSSTQVARRGVFPRLRDARIRAKLALILVVPLVAVIALATTRLVDVGQRAADAAQVEELTKLETDVSALTQLLHVERMAGAAYIAGILPIRTEPDSAAKAYQAAVRASDAQIQVYRSHRADVDNPPGTVLDRLARIDDHLNTMDATRTAIGDRGGIAVAEVVSRYSVVITDLVSYGDAVSQVAGDGDIADRLRAIAAFSRAKAGTAEQEAVSYAARVTNDLSAEQRTTFIATQTSQQEALQAFSLVADPTQRSLVDNVVSGDAVNLVDGVATRLARAGSSASVTALEITQSFGAVVDLMRWAEQELESAVVRQATDDRDSVVRQAAIEAALVVLVLIVAITLAVILARSLNMSLRRLREGALAVANRDLPDAVARLRDARNLGEGGADDFVREIRDPIKLPNRDEIGQVGQAFNVVHREAVRIAAEQAALRTSVSTMFLNLARRSQSLVDRMIGELDHIERTEEDPKRLAQLFELDHLATRMRRNDENLLVLAGADSSAPRREDALLVDALRASQSEVELYNRIEFGTVDTDISIAALAVNDVVRLVAELLDNATRFSPPTTIVVADGRRIRDYVVIQVEDRGLGMSEEQMDQLNRRLAEPPSVDVAAFRLMGLAVVGRLAARYGIRVELRANLEGGTVAQVTLPSSIVVLPSRRLDAPSRPQELGTAPYGGNTGGWDARNARAATATLPTIAPEPSWREPTPQPQTAHPSLPMFPSQRPPSEPDTRPTPNRPPLPTRATKAIDETAPTMNGFAAATPLVVIPPVASAPPAPTGSGWGAALAAMPPAPPPPVVPSAQERDGTPIFVQMQQSWFRNHEGASQEEWGMPTAGYAPPPNGAVSPAPAKPAAAAPAPAPAKPAPPPAAPPRTNGHNGPSVPKPRSAPEDRWKTSADEGWQKAMAAAEPVDAGTTRSGLPKRVPQAQLVPGGVQPGPSNQNRRSPDEVRGLLSAYHRGVQRGRTDGTAESTASQAKEI
ncbi:sensor histidine kinase [Paractinoplanes bogorensis]|uniref:sensor histidine kinase n=1 Tax=Paractinoplanes bogorensis TaxID=1610840 RepID=UPI0027DFEEA9|nr:nitrate- and nitrite sensing domain-containing protein [Actinoplanes bogorensis]